MTEVHVENGLEQAMQGYREFLQEAPVSALTPEAMRRLADLQLEKEFGINGGAQAPAHQAAKVAGVTPTASTSGSAPASIADRSETEEEFETTVATIESLPFAYLHVFSYSERPNARSKDLDVANVATQVVRKSAL